MLSREERPTGEYLRNFGYVMLGLAALLLAILSQLAVATAVFLLVSGALSIAEGHGIVRKENPKFWRILYFIGFPLGFVVIGIAIYYYPPAMLGIWFGLLTGIVLFLLWWLTRVSRARHIPRGE